MGCATAIDGLLKPKTSETQVYNALICIVAVFLLEIAYVIGESHWHLIHVKLSSSASRLSGHAQLPFNCLSNL